MQQQHPSVKLSKFDLASARTGPLFNLPELPKMYRYGDTRYTNWGVRVDVFYGPYYAFEIGADLVTITHDPIEAEWKYMGRLTTKDVIFNIGKWTEFPDITTLIQVMLTKHRLEIPR